MAIRERDTTVTPNVYSVKYQHTDALGSPVAITNESRGEVERTYYEPYGRPANRPWRDGPGYTGHVEDAATQLTYMQQRYYDPMLGVFLSVDPVTAYSSPISQFHRYRYANGNPYKFTDPDGRVANDRTRGPFTNACGGEAICLSTGGGGRRSTNSGGRRSSSSEVRTTQEAVHLVRGRSIEREIQRLYPGRPTRQFIGPVDGPAYNRVTNEALSRDLVAARSDIASRIANNGHSFERHVLNEGQFPGVRTISQYRNVIENALTNYTSFAVGARGQSWFYHAPSSTIVVVNPNGRYDGGSAWQVSPQRAEALMSGN